MFISIPALVYIVMYIPLMSSGQMCSVHVHQYSWSINICGNKLCDFHDFPILTFMFTKRSAFTNQVWIMNLWRPAMSVRSVFTLNVYQ